MKNFWKILAISALAAGLVPYHIRRNEEGKVTSCKALFWEFSRNDDPTPEHHTTETVYHQIEVTPAE